MSKLTWDNVGQKLYGYGVSKGVLFTFDSTANKWVGHAWSGLTNVTDSPDGGDAEDKYADNILYASVRGVEKLTGTIEAFTAPDEWDECIGKASVMTGVTIGQQGRKTFGFAYRSEIGSDTDPEKGYIIHVVYGCTAKAAEISHDTTEDSVDFEPMSFDYESVPVNITGHKPASKLEFNSLTLPAAQMTKLEEILYGVDAGEGVTGSDSYLPLPDTLFDLLEDAT